MIAKVKSTGKEYDIISVRVSYGDDYHDFWSDDIEIISDDNVDWEEFRRKTAMTMLSSLVDRNTTIKEKTTLAIKYTDELINTLKNGK